LLRKTPEISAPIEGVIASTLNIAISISNLKEFYNNNNNNNN
jgi:hypothetical protein